MRFAASRTGVLVATGLYDITVAGVERARLGPAGGRHRRALERALCSGCSGERSGPLPAFAIAALIFAALHLANPAATTLAGATGAVAGLMFSAY